MIKSDKSYQLIIFLLLFTSRLSAQNHIYNASFEQYTTCPTALTQGGTNCVGWQAIGNSSPEYFHECGSPNVDVPSNMLGYQYAAHGSAYIGFFSYLPSVSNFREYLHTQITPLQQGKIYRVAMSVSLANAYEATNGLGVFFFDTGYTTSSIATMLAQTPQVSYNSYGTIKDTLNWVRLTKYITADSSYDHLVVGCFLDDNTINIDTISNTNNSYYYIDSIVVEEVDPFSVSISDTVLCVNDTVDIIANVVQKYSVINTYTVQVSDASGSFSNPITIGTKTADSTDTITCVIPSSISPGSGYRFRVIASSPSDTSTLNPVTLSIGNLDSANIQLSVNDTLCSGDTLHFNTSHNATSISFLRTGPNNFNSTIQSPYIANTTTNHSGTYYSQITTYGCILVDTFNVLVKQSPSKPTASSNSSVCAGDTLKLFSSNNSNGVSFSWSGPNSYSSSNQNPVINNTTTAMTGTYIATSTINGCSKSDTTSVNVLVAPSNPSLSSNSPVCESKTLQLNASNSTSGVSYAWTGPSSFSSSAQNPVISTVNVNQSGWYKGTISINGCVFTDSINVVINPTPQKPILSYNAPLCVSDTLKLSASNVINATYTWFGPNNFNSAIQNPFRSNITFSDTGVYYGFTTIANCNSDTSSVNVSISPTPFVVILANKDSICQGETISFNTLPNNSSGNLLYQWYINAQVVNGATNSQYSTPQLNNGDIISCEMTDLDKCYSPYTDPSNDIKVKVLAWLAPQVSITASPGFPIHQDTLIEFQATSVDAGSQPNFQWYRNDQQIIGATSDKWSSSNLNDNDSINVKVFSNYYCPNPDTGSSNKIVVKILSGINDKMSRLDNFNVYPNPNNGLLYIDFYSLKNNKVFINLVGTSGIIIFSETIELGNTQTTHKLDLTNIPKGVYTLIISSENIISKRYKVLIGK